VGKAEPKGKSSGSHRRKTLSVVEHEISRLPHASGFHLLIDEERRAESEVQPASRNAFLAMTHGTKLDLWRCSLTGDRNENPCRLRPPYSAALCMIKKSTKKKLKVIMLWRTRLCCPLATRKTSDTC
jgi:hypothetical protein